MTGIDLIAKERQRQTDKEGWSAEHDDSYDNFQLSDAAICYANCGAGGPFSHPTTGRPPPLWPWSHWWWKPSPDPIANLVKAGALIAAEIDRLQRKEATT